MKDPVDPSRDGDQLVLPLFEGVPWDGRSPRVLTKGFIPLFLRRKPSESTRLVEDWEQLEFWPTD